VALKRRRGRSRNSPTDTANFWQRILRLFKILIFSYISQKEDFQQQFCTFGRKFSDMKKYFLDNFSIGQYLRAPLFFSCRDAHDDNVGMLCLCLGGRDKWQIADVRWIPLRRGDGGTSSDAAGMSSRWRHRSVCSKLFPVDDARSRSPEDRSRVRRYQQPSQTRYRFLTENITSAQNVYFSLPTFLKRKTFQKTFLFTTTPVRIQSMKSNQKLLR